MLGQVLPDVYTRFGEAAAKSAEVKRGLDALLTATDLQGLPSVFTALGLLRDEGAKTVFDTTATPLREVLQEIERAAAEGTKATGKALAEQFGRPDFGWDFEVVRLLVAALLRAGAIQMTHKAQMIESTTSIAARDALTNNNHFRAASFQPKKGVDFVEIAKAAEHFKSTFGAAVKELALTPVVAEIRAALTRSQDDLQTARDQLVLHGLPGAAVLEDALAQARAIQRGTEDTAIVRIQRIVSDDQGRDPASGRDRQSTDADCLARDRESARTRSSNGGHSDAEPDLGARHPRGRRTASLTR